MPSRVVFSESFRPYAFFESRSVSMSHPCPQDHALALGGVCSKADGALLQALTGEVMTL